MAHRGLNEYLLSVYLPEWRAWRLTPTERRLVMALLPPGRLVTHDTLLQRVWGPEYAGEMRLLHVNLSRVRIAIHPHGWTITSVPAVGYLLERCEPGPAPKQRVMHRRPCPDCGGPMKAESNRCQVCVRRQQAERVARFRVCPDCGGEKSPHGRRCKPCHLRRVALGRLGRPVKVVAP